MKGPSSGAPGEPTGRFSKAWDDYADRSCPSAGQWPGDEWGDERLWAAWFDRLFEPFGVRQWRRAIEIGQGAGKYTEKVLVAGDSNVLALDVSEKLRVLCERRLKSHVASGRLRIHGIDERDPDAIARAWRDAGWEGDVDAIYSIDALVHLTVTQVVALMLSGTEVLRVGGWFIGTFADGTSALGLNKLIFDMDRVVRGGSDPATACFHWCSPDLIRSLARHLGYEVAVCDLDPEHRRDGHFVLRFADRKQAAIAMSFRNRGTIRTST